MDKEIKETLIEVFVEMKTEITQNKTNSQISKNKHTQTHNIFVSDIYDVINSIITKTFILRPTSYFYFTKDKNDSFNKDFFGNFIDEEIQLIKGYSNIDNSDNQKYIDGFIIRLQDLIS